MNYSFEIASIRFEVEFRKIKTLCLTVYPPNSQRPAGMVKIAAPIGTTQDFIQKFAISKIEWVKNQQERFQKNQVGKKLKAEDPLKNNSTVFLWGNAYKLEIIERSGHPKIVIDSGCMKFFVRPDSTKAKRQEVFDKWYRKITKKAAEEKVKELESSIGVTVKKLYVQKMKTHWGSCNYKKQTLRLNSELAKRDPICLNYVIVHEMLHIIEKGHNQNYYRLMSKYFPDWKSIRKKMNSGEL